MLVLASNSPRRKQLLGLTGWDFVVQAAWVDERVQPGERPEAYVRRLAEEKARSALEQARPALDADALVVAADTAVVDLDGEVILGKPGDAAEAERMLRSLRGRRHQVLSGLAALRAADGRLASRVATTEVWMRAYSEAEMRAYIASGDPLDKAGAYAIQHAGFHPVQRLQGCYANVVGLPVCQLRRLLIELGARLPTAAGQDCRPEAEQPCEVYRRMLAQEASQA
jgi:MAF protein